jgi:hypothetical protein
MVGSAQLVFQEEIVLEQGEIRRNPKISLTEVDKNSDQKNRVRVKMNQLNLVVVQKITKEITDWNTKHTLEEGGEHHNFICLGYQNVLTGSRCHTPFRERGNEASIRVPRMFKSHVQ